MDEIEKPGVTSGPWAQWALGPNGPAPWALSPNGPWDHTGPGPNGPCSHGPKRAPGSMDPGPKQPQWALGSNGPGKMGRADLTGEVAVIGLFMATRAANCQEMFCMALPEPQGNPFPLPWPHDPGGGSSHISWPSSPYSSIRQVDKKITQGPEIGEINKNDRTDVPKCLGPRDGSNPENSTGDQEISAPGPQIWY